jgi:hypothetical protein
MPLPAPLPSRVRQETKVTLSRPSLRAGRVTERNWLRLLLPRRLLLIIMKTSYDFGLSLDRSLRICSFWLAGVRIQGSHHAGAVPENVECKSVEMRIQLHKSCQQSFFNAPKLAQCECKKCLRTSPLSSSFRCGRPGLHKRKLYTGYGNQKKHKLRPLAGPSRVDSRAAEAG